MDLSLGVRYQVFNETKCRLPWLANVDLSSRGGIARLLQSANRFRARGPFCGNRTGINIAQTFRLAGLEAMRMGCIAGIALRNDQYIVSVGLFQQIKGWELELAIVICKRISGGGISFRSSNPGGLVTHETPGKPTMPSMLVSSYTTFKHRIRYAFESRTVFDRQQHGP